MSQGGRNALLVTMVSILLELLDQNPALSITEILEEHFLTRNDLHNDKKNFEEDRLSSVVSTLNTKLGNCFTL